MLADSGLMLLTGDLESTDTENTLSVFELSPSLRSFNGTLGIKYVSAFSLIRLNPSRKGCPGTWFRVSQRHLSVYRRNTNESAAAANKRTAGLGYNAVVIITMKDSHLNKSMESVELVVLWGIRQSLDSMKQS